MRTPPLAQRGAGLGYTIAQVPYRGVEQTVEWMVRLAREGQTDPVLRRHAEEVIRKVHPKDYRSEVAAIYYDVCRRIRYTRDPAGAELVHHPVLTHANKAADCDDLAVYLRALLGAYCQSVGNDCEFVTAGFVRNAPPQNRYTHVFLRVRGPQGEWLVLDPVAGPDTQQMIRRATAAQAWRPYAV